MNRIRYYISLIFGAAILGAAALVSRVVFSHGVFPWDFRIFLIWFGISLVCITINTILVSGLERFFSVRPVLAHSLAAIAMAAIFIVLQLWDMARRGTPVGIELLVKGIVVPTLGMAIIVSSTAFFAYSWGGRRSQF